MKKLTYSIALLSLVLIVASCKKNEELLPVTRINNTQSVTPPVCDSTKLVSFVLNNTTGTGSYAILFNGSTNYEFNIPAGVTTALTVKPGIYSITIYPPGNMSEYNYFVESLGYRLPIKQSGAKINDVNITSCNGPQSLGIVQ